jgi:hypothetical protein
MPVAGAPVAGLDAMPNELICLIFKSVLRRTRCYHIKKEFLGRRKSPNLGQWLVPVATKCTSAALLNSHANNLFYKEVLKCATSAKKPTKMVAYISNLDFRPLMNFLKHGLGAAQKKTMSESQGSKIIAVLEFNSNGLKYKEFGRWISFIAASDVRIEYMLGGSDKPDTVAFQLQELLSVFDDSEDMEAIYKACMIGKINLRAAAERVNALYEDLSEAEAGSDDRDAVDRAAADGSTRKGMAATLAKQKAWKGYGLGAMVGLESTAGVDEDEGGDNPTGEDDSDDDPENMSDDEE